jgi:hypothetical protein
MNLYQWLSNQYNGIQDAVSAIQSSNFVSKVQADLAPQKQLIPGSVLEAIAEISLDFIPFGGEIGVSLELAVDVFQRLADIGVGSAEAVEAVKTQNQKAQVEVAQINQQIANIVSALQQSLSTQLANAFVNTAGDTNNAGSTSVFKALQGGVFLGPIPSRQALANTMQM